MKKNFVFIVLGAALLMAGFSLVLCFEAKAQTDDNLESTEAAGPLWEEQRLDGASFASDWLNDLDNEDYDKAAAVYTVDGDQAELSQRLRAMRADLGKYSERNFVSAYVAAVANDESEHKVQVVFSTVYPKGTIIETVDVLLWPKGTVVLAYTVENE